MIHWAGWWPNMVCWAVRWFTMVCQVAWWSNNNRWILRWSKRINQAPRVAQRSYIPTSSVSLRSDDFTVSWLESSMMFSLHFGCFKASLSKEDDHDTCGLSTSQCSILQLQHRHTVQNNFYHCIWTASVYQVSIAQAWGFKFCNLPLTNYVQCWFNKVTGFFFHQAVSVLYGTWILCAVKVDSITSLLCSLSWDHCLWNMRMVHHISSSPLPSNKQTDFLSNKQWCFHFCVI